jgi:hypothetical protein
MRPWKRLLAAAALAMPVTALADPVGYAVGSGGDGFGGSSTLWRLDLATGAATLVGPIGYVDVEGLTLATDGTLYAVADAGLACAGCPGTTDVLLRIDPQSGEGSLVGPLGLAAQGDLDYGLGATCDGRLWLSSDTSGNLWEVNRFGGGTRLVGALGAPVSGLAGWGEDLYGISVADDLALYRIDVDSGAATRLGALGLPSAFYDAGLDFDADGQLWASIDYFSPPPPDDLLPEPLRRNDIARVDPDTGAASIVTAISGAGTGLASVQMEGLAIATGGGCGGAEPPPGPEPAMATVPVDAPAGLLALCSALLLLGAFRLRRGA